jgi:hypothetical protein
MSLINIEPLIKTRLEAGERFSSDRLSFFVFSLCALSVLAQASLILFSWDKLPPQIPFFYSKPWGEQMLASPVALWILPGVCALLVLVNFSIVIFWIKENIFLWRVLIIFSLLVSFVTLYDTVKIISLLT